MISRDFCVSKFLFNFYAHMLTCVTIDFLNIMPRILCWCQKFHKDKKPKNYKTTYNINKNIYIFNYVCIARGLRKSRFSYPFFYPSKLKIRKSQNVFFVSSILLEILSFLDIVIYFWDFSTFKKEIVNQMVETCYKNYEENMSKVF